MPGESEISLDTFRNRPAVGGRKATVPPRVQKLVDLMIWGGKSDEEAAKEIGIKVDSARKYLRHPTARAHYLANLTQLRDSERARNLHAAVEIRDDDKLKKSAAGARARIEAARFLEGEPEDMRRGQQPSATVSPGIVVMVSVERTPVVDHTLIEVNPGVPV